MSKTAAKKTAGKREAALTEAALAAEKSAEALAPPGSAEALAEFLPEARALAEKDVRTMRADPALAYHNVTAGLAALAPHESTLATLPAPFDLAAMKSSGRLALALIYAAAQVDRSSSGKTQKLLSKAATARDLLLTNAVALAKSGVLPTAKVKKIQSGRGSRDMVQDCVDLAALFRENAAAIKGKTAVTKAQIDEAAAVGDELLKILKPARAKAKIPDDVQAAVDTRDRLWTLLQIRHRDNLRRAGAWIWVDDVDEHVPALQSGSGGPKRTEKVTPAAPT